MAPDPLWVDMVITWTGAAGVIAYIRYILSQRTRSSLEDRTLLLLYCLAALFVARGIYWWTMDAASETMVFLIASLLPLATVLFGEGLLRRHLPLSFKVYVALGTVSALPAVLSRALPTIEPVFFVFSLFTVTTGVCVWLMLVLRDRSDLSETENRLANAVAAALVIGLPLVVTDFRQLLPWIPVRAGAIGGLILIYACVRTTRHHDRKRVVLGEIGAMLAKAGVVAASFMAISGYVDVNMLVRTVATALAFVLLFTITGRLRALRIGNEDRSFLHTLLEADDRSPGAFIDSQRRAAVLEEHLILGPERLNQYDAGVIADMLERNHGVCRLATLRTDTQAAAKSGIDGAEQLIDLLESYGMSHVCLIGRTPLTLLLVNFPQLASGQTFETELAVIQKFANVIARQQNHGA